MLARSSVRACASLTHLPQLIRPPSCTDSASVLLQEMARARDPASSPGLPASG